MEYTLISILHYLDVKKLSKVGCLFLAAGPALVSIVKHWGTRVVHTLF